MFQPNWPTSGVYSDKDIAAHCNALFLSTASASGYIWLHMVFSFVCSCLCVFLLGRAFCFLLFGHHSLSALMANF
jgi:hypothetical protein